mmetsp:Transcript_28753/g.62989  ORF Transcript_28753/g.62989 Transcript_28753/m.62989 type:complete len:399 (-) Transcript_28753:287-1483(-)|eukprot:CAMPEP_0118923252 /NCGR_PEP_ID=MMETSP1169-20130426/1851_1 /TAXON_ID=36882 /ORGANISM="Pyramimonas obovata, Strain CCMP722" /LENGTH=398 /DNA_ID=CAMNT_0006864219 /DNA_START=128 /DNA_END=1324 /DNA_ORIENTATION=+
MQSRGESDRRVVDALLKEYDRYESAASALFEQFVAFDTDLTTTLNYDECYIFLEEHGLFKDIPPAEKDKIMDTYFTSADEDGSGSLDFSEFVKAHSAVVKYRREHCLPAVQSLTSEKLVAACKRAKETQMQKLREVKRREEKSKSLPNGRLRNTEPNFVEHLARQRSTQLLMQAFTELDTQKTGRIALEDFFEQMCKLGYTDKRDHSKSLFAEFSKKHPTLSELSFDMVLQIMFPDLSAAQRQILSQRARAPSTDTSKVQAAKQHKVKRLSKVKSLHVDEETRRNICQIFADLDQNEDRLLDVDEFIDLMADVRSEEECEKLFHEIDVDGSGTLDVWEFVAWWTTSQRNGQEYLRSFGDRLLDFTQTNYRAENPVLESCLDVQCNLTAAEARKAAYGY